MREFLSTLYQHGKVGRLDRWSFLLIVTVAAVLAYYSYVFSITGDVNARIREAPSSGLQSIYWAVYGGAALIAVAGRLNDIGLHGRWALLLVPIKLLGFPTYYSVGLALTVLLVLLPGRRPPESNRRSR